MSVAASCAKEAPAGSKAWWAGPNGNPKLSLAILFFISYFTLSWLQWFVTKRLLASSGAAVNSTYHAVVEVFALLGQFGGFALLPLTSLASRAYQASDVKTIFGLTGVTLQMGFVTGIFGMLVMEIGAPFLIQFFEDTQPLLPSAPLHCRLMGLVFPFAVVNGGLVALLAGCAEYAFPFAAAMPTNIVSLLFSLYFWWSGRLVVFVLNFMVNQVLIFALFAWRVRHVLRGLRPAKAAADLQGEADAADTSGDAGGIAPPDADADKAAAQLRYRKGLAAESVSTPQRESRLCIGERFRELQPSGAVWQDVFNAAGNNCMRNATLASKGFIVALCATRLGNAAGSAHAVQEQIATYLGGFVSLWCIGTTVAASRILEAKMPYIFDIQLKVQWALFTVICGVWFYLFGVGGCERVMRLGGVGRGSEDASSSQASAHSMEEHLLVVSTAAHWMWAAHVVLNAFAAPLDIVLLSLKSYQFLGKLYCGLLFLVILPSLLASQHAELFFALEVEQSASATSVAARAAAVPYAGIQFSLLLTAIVRLAGNCWRLYWVEIPMRKQLEAVADDKMSREIIMGFAKMVTQDIDRFWEKRRELGFLGFITWFRRPDGEMATWCEKHGSTIDAMDRTVFRLKAANDKEVIEASTVFDKLFAPK